jgi:hypothetical protein
MTLLYATNAKGSLLKRGIGHRFVNGGAAFGIEITVFRICS